MDQRNFSSNRNDMKTKSGPVYENFCCIWIVDNYWRKDKRMKGWKVLQIMSRLPYWNFSQIYFTFCRSFVRLSFCVRRRIEFLSSWHNHFYIRCLHLDSTVYRDIYIYIYSSNINLLQVLDRRACEEINI